MESKDKKLGYFIIFLVLTALISISGYLYYLYGYGYYDITVTFPNLGILAIDDAVKIRGKQVGRVKSIDLVDNQAEVTIEMWTPVSFREDCIITEKDRGLMGDREIDILPGSSERKLDIEKPISGRYKPGIAESMALVQNLRKKLDTLTALVEGYAHGTGGHIHFEKEFNSLVAKIEDISSAMETALVKVAVPLNKNVDALHQFSGDVKRVSSGILDKSGKALHASGDMIVKIDTALSVLGPVIDSVDVMITALSQDTGRIGELIHSPATLDSISLRLKKINSNLSLFRRKGRININLF